MPTVQPDQNSNLGWEISKSKPSYDSRLPVLSPDERDFLLVLSARFSDYSRSHDVADPEAAREAVGHLLPLALESEGLEIDDEQRQYLTAAALSHLAGFAPLDSMLCDPQVEEIAALGVDKPVYVYVRAKGWAPTNARITSMEHLVHLINKMARPLGRRITSQYPRLNALLSNGSRLHASIPPLSGGEITIRLHSARPWSALDLMSSHSTNAEALAFLWLAFQSDSSVMIVGNTSSGKTTLLNALFSFVPMGERVVLIEETPELRLLHPHRVQLVSSEELSIGMSDLVRDSLRMRPDRVIVGEVRTPPEAQAFAETLLSGQARGSYATFHGQSAAEALRRLRNLGISADDLPSLDFIVLQRRIARYDPKTLKQEELRRMLGIYMLRQKQVGNEKTDKKAASARGKSSVSLSASSLSPSVFSSSDAMSSIELVPIFTYDPRADKLAPAPGLGDALERLSSRLGMDRASAHSIYQSRKQFLSRLKPAAPDDITKKVQEFAYR